MYYKWTQWIFSEMYRAGLAYQEPRMQWWCTKCQTVLANEQVIDGKCWRHDAADDPEVAKKEVKQWFFKVTEYADEMLAATDDLDWSEVVKSAQKNWIGKSRGAEIEFAIAASETRDKRQEPRDSLKFTPELTRMILDGKKTCTIRLDAKKLEIGDIAEFMTRDGELVAPFGYAKITRVRSMKLGDIPNDLKGHEVLRDDAHKLKNYRGYYGDKVNLETTFTIYDFEFNFDSRFMTHDSTITVFTTRPDTIFGAAFLVIAPEHEMLRQIVTDDARGAVEDYVKQALKKSELERQEEKVKTGVPTGAHAINPATREKIPIWVADYVLSGYGTGAIMAVPAHDERDYEFATKFQLPIRRVVVQDFGTVLQA
jgi:leucyl-tRNA synthetase